MSELTQEEALRAFARMMNRLDPNELLPLLADDIHYASQWVFEEIESKADYADYIVPKLKAVYDAGSEVWAEMGLIEGRWGPHCVIVAQDDQENLKAVVLAQVKDGKLQRLDMCFTPSPSDVERTGDYPGM